VENLDFSIAFGLMYRLSFASQRSRLGRHQWTKDGNYSYVMKVATQNTTESDEPNFKSTLQRNSKYRIIYFNQITGLISAWSEPFEANAHKKPQTSITSKIKMELLTSTKIAPKKSIQKKTLLQQHK
jgi:hypothetical protein